MVEVLQDSTNMCAHINRPLRTVLRMAVLRNPRLVEERTKEAMSYAYRRRKKTLRKLQAFKKSHVMSRGGNTGMFNYDFFNGETMKHNLDKLKEGQAILWWTIAILAGSLAICLW